ncbi:hypothetical protein [Ideonella sp.]|uniref:hypothetical protein n=1 Tax=Ideonella sp. TaxID=1929293 RepID=UPI002B47E73B|nr:hypothetical protein [Ideonella sp.]HJV71570.1 hypothetical protein [Ideonella sp.]
MNAHRHGSHGERRADVLAARRHHLVAHAALQRQTLRSDTAHLQAQLAPAAMLARGLAGVRRRPSWLLAGAAALVVLKRFGTRRLLGHALTAWQLWQTIRRWRSGRGRTGTGTP